MGFDSKTDRVHGQPPPSAYPFSNEDEVLAIISMRRSVNRDPFHGHPYSSTVLDTNVREYDMDDPTLPRQSDGSIARPPPGGLGCLACADNVNMRSPSHIGNPKNCRWYDKGDYHWECPSCKKNYGHD
eukprot:7835316-Pyramimonas_sp.AAC.1